MKQDAQEEVAEAGRVLSALGLVTAYGHVSARAGNAMLSHAGRRPRHGNRRRIVTVPLETAALPAGAPAEAWAHLALYRSRPDAAAIARAQPPSAFAAAASAPRVPVSPASASSASAFPASASAASAFPRLRLSSLCRGSLLHGRLSHNGGRHRAAGSAVRAGGLAG